jgi:EAL domain-containing protein (putative c-di-GMP-specific phosphodiesterase class I)/ActR/RegA family two-component response regulator
VLRVLLLDDEPLVLDTLAVCLSAPGVHLTTCRELEAAEALLGILHFDVLATDLSLSRLGGLEGLRLVRFVATHFPDTTVYVLSAHVDEEVRSLAAVLGAAKVLEKPAGLTELRLLLLQHRDAAGFGSPTPPRDGPVDRLEPLEDFIASGSLQALLQPVVKLPTAGGAPSLFGVESLARGPSGTLLRDPAILFAYAARKELLFEVDMICIRAALAAVRELGLPVAAFVNVQPRSMTNPDFAGCLSEAVCAASLVPDGVVIELNEQQTIVNPRAFASTLAALRQLGFRVALDDFGEGSSNLSLFQDLRPEFLKISGTFSKNLASDSLRQILVRSTAEMAARAGTATVMEAVETAEDAALLPGLGIDYAQGYYFSQPLPAAELVRSPLLAPQHAARIP